MSSPEGSEISPCLQVMGTPPCQGCRPKTWDTGARHSRRSGSVSRRNPRAHVGAVHTGRDPASGKHQPSQGTGGKPAHPGPDGGVIGILDSKSVLHLEGEMLLSVLPGDLLTASLERAARPLLGRHTTQGPRGLSSMQVCAVSLSWIITHSRCFCQSLFLIGVARRLGTAVAGGGSGQGPARQPRAPRQAFLHSGKFLN